MQRPAYLWIINLFIVITIAALIAISYLTLARATILIPGEEKEINETVQVPVAQGGGDGATQGEAVGGEIVSREIEVSETVPLGATVSKSSKAGGSVTIHNTYNRSQTLVRTTRLLSTGGALFRITDAVTVAPGASIDVFAEADQPGDEYLIAPAKFTIPGLWVGIQDQIYAESRQPMTYDRTAEAAVTQKDIDGARESLIQKGTDAALAELQKNSALALADKKLATAELIGIESVPPVGQKAQQVTVKALLRVTAVLVKRDDLISYVSRKLSNGLSLAPALALDPAKLSYALESLNRASSTAQLSVGVSATARTTEKNISLNLEQLKGKTPSAARRVLENNGIPGAEIKLFPPFLPILPLLADHIEVKVK